MYKLLTRSPSIRVDLESPAYLGLGIIFICHVYASNALPYTHGSRIPRLLGVRNYLNNYFSMYMRLTLSRINADLASHTYFWLRIIKIIILPCINA